MENIIIDVGVHTALTIDLSNFDFSGIEKVIFTIKNYPDINFPAVVEREYLKPQVYHETITPEESIKIRSNAEYDFDYITNDGKRYKATDNGKIVLRKVVGDCIDE